MNIRLLVSHRQRDGSLERQERSQDMWFKGWGTWFLLVRSMDEKWTLTWLTMQV